MEEAKDRLIFALDVPNLEQCIEWVKELKDSVGCFKVGLELFIAEGPDLFRIIRGISGAWIFLDLKLHDIPATVNRALWVAAGLEVDFMTVHCAGGRKMLGDAKAFDQTGMNILGVTVLTSEDSNDSQLVLDRAKMACSAGCAGVVCPGREVKAVKEACGPDFLVVVPGIRPAWSVVEGDDQSRVTTPGQAIAAGADYIVVGRPIRDAPDPPNAARRIVEEIRFAL